MGRRTVRISPDSNILIRFTVRDDPEQAAVARRVLDEATSIVLAIPCLCEFVWVLRRAYRFSAADVQSALVTLLDAQNVILDRPAVEAGIAFLEAGGDFADGVIAYQTRWMGAEVFVSFDRKAVELSNARGYPARLLT